MPSVSFVVKPPRASPGSSLPQFRDLPRHSVAANSAPHFRDIRVFRGPHDARQAPFANLATLRDTTAGDHFLIGGERGGLIEKKEFGVIMARGHQFSLPPIEFELAIDPAFYGAPLTHELFVIVVQPTPIPHQRPALRRRDDLPERVNSILQRHDAAHEADSKNTETYRVISVREIRGWKVDALHVNTAIGNK